MRTRVVVLGACFGGLESTTILSGVCGAATMWIGALAPDLGAGTALGRIRFHRWDGDSRAALSSQPKEFTPQGWKATKPYPRIVERPRS